MTDQMEISKLDLMLERAIADPVGLAEDHGHDFTGLPETLRDGYARWWCTGIEAGDFLQSVIENDLFGALGRADHVNQTRLHSICTWFYNNADARCYKEHSKTWGEHRGYVGRELRSAHSSLEASILSLENTDRLGHEGQERLAACQRKRRRVATLLESLGMPTT